MFKTLFGVVAMFTLLFGIGVGSSNAYPYSVSPGLGTNNTDVFVLSFDYPSSSFNDFHIQYTGAELLIGANETTDFNDYWTGSTNSLGGGVMESTFESIGGAPLGGLLLTSGGQEYTILGWQFTNDGVPITGTSTGSYVPELPTGAVIPMGLALLGGMAWLRRKNFLLVRTAI